MMNRYTICGMIRDARAGLTVAHVGRYPRRTLDVLEEALGLDGEPGIASVDRGRACVRFTSGGAIHLKSTNPHAGRGLDADIVVLDDGTADDFDIVSTYFVSVRHRGGELVRA